MLKGTPEKAADGLRIPMPADPPRWAPAEDRSPRQRDAIETTAGKPRSKDRNVEIRRRHHPSDEYRGAMLPSPSPLTRRTKAERTPGAVCPETMTVEDTSHALLPGASHAAAPVGVSPSVRRNRASRPRRRRRLSRRGRGRDGSMSWRDAGVARSMRANMHWTLSLSSRSGDCCTPKLATAWTWRPRNKRRRADIVSRPPVPGRIHRRLPWHGAPRARDGAGDERRITSAGSSRGTSNGTGDRDGRGEGWIWEHVPPEGGRAAHRPGPRRGRRFPQRAPRAPPLRPAIGSQLGSMTGSVSRAARTLLRQAVARTTTRRRTRVEPGVAHRGSPCPRTCRPRSSPAGAGCRPGRRRSGTWA